MECWSDLESEGSDVRACAPSSSPWWNLTARLCCAQLWQAVPAMPTESRPLGHGFVIARHGLVVRSLESRVREAEPPVHDQPNRNVGNREAVAHHVWPVFL